MSVTPIEFMALAHELKNSLQEAGRRTAVSRAYYACHHLVKHYMLANSIEVPSEIAKSTGAHDAIIKTLTMASSDARAKSIGYQLQEAKKNRVTSDYLIEDNVSPEVSMMAVNLCDRLFEKVNS